MKYEKKPMALILSLVLCMGLSACGNDPPKPPPDSFEGMVKESKISEESSRYQGSWQGEEENRLEIEKSGETEEVRVALYDAKGEIYASGYLQPVKKYGADYFYNEHDGMAHRTWIDSENSDVLLWTPSVSSRERQKARRKRALISSRWKALGRWMERKILPVCWISMTKAAGTCANGQGRKANSKKWTAAPCARKAKAASKPSLTITKASCTT